MTRLVSLLSLSLAAVSATAPPAGADDGPKGHVSVRFLTELNTVPLTIDTEPVAAWLKPVIAAVEARFPKEAGRKAIVVQVTLHHDGPAEVELAGDPALSEEDVKALRSVADPAKAPRSKVATCSFRVVARDQEGNPDELPGLTPALKGPYQRLLERVRSAPTREGLGLLKGWAVTEALPLLAASARDAEAKYAGVRGLGAALTKALADPKAPPSVEALATKNPDFWRATVEMQRGNPLAPAVETSLLIAAGRVEWAQQVAAAAGFFDARKSGSSALLGFGRTLAEAYLKGVNDRIVKAIALHDAGQLDEALAALDAVLKDDPDSAWAVYERFHTRRVMRMKAKGAGGLTQPDLWPEARARIIRSNPLYQTMGEANGREGLFDLTRRAALAGLFKDPQAAAKDIIAYADVALDLGAFDMAAMLYWSIATNIESKVYDNRPLLETFLYALDRLGVNDLKGNFKGDHAAAFAAIEADRRRRVEGDPEPAKPETTSADPKSPPDRP